MQKIFAAVLVILGLAGLVVGRLGETTWAPSTEQTATVDLSDAGPAVIIDPGVLYVGGEVGTVEITAGSDISIITAANDDIPAFLGDVKHTRITGVPTWDTLSTEVVNPDGPTTIENPTDSDLWRSVETVPSPATIDVAEFSAQENDAESPQPYRAILLVTDGEQPAADAVSITWPVDARNEWVPYAYAGGAALAVIGLIWFVLAFRAGRPLHEEVEDATPQSGGAEVASLESSAAGEPTTVSGRQTSLATGDDPVNRTSDDEAHDATGDEHPAAPISDDDPGPRDDHAQDAEDEATDEPAEEFGSLYEPASVYTSGEPFARDTSDDPSEVQDGSSADGSPSPEPIIVEGRGAGDPATEADPRRSTDPQVDPEPTEALPPVEAGSDGDQETTSPTAGHGRRRGAPREDRP